MFLHEFAEETRKEIEAFESWWGRQHLAKPEIYPLEFPKADSGLWFEQFLFFCQLTAEERQAELEKDPEDYK